MPCNNKSHRKRIYQKGNFWVMENFLKATHGDLNCFETITYTTNGEFPFLDNLVSIVDRWHAPISLALYCGGEEDYKNCHDTLVYLRHCLENQSAMHYLRQYLSVHIFFEDTMIPVNVSSRPIKIDILSEPNINCRSREV